MPGGAEGRRGVGLPAELRLGLGSRGARGRGLVCVWPGPGHVRLRTPPPPAFRSRSGPPRTMGSILSRRIAGVEDIDIQANSAYRYPPKSGERPLGSGSGGRDLVRSTGGQSVPARGCPQRVRRGLCSVRGPPGASRPGAPRDVPSDRGWGSGLPAPSPSGLGDLGSVTSPLGASASLSAHRGDSVERPRTGLRFGVRRWPGVSTLLGASLVLTKWSLSKGLTSRRRQFGLSLVAWCEDRPVVLNTAHAIWTEA